MKRITYCEWRNKSTEDVTEQEQEECEEHGLDHFHFEGEDE